MVQDDRILNSIPEFIGIGTMLKAHPHMEGGDRIIYVEASREDRDQQNEIVLAKALEDSADHFIKFGQLDLDHKSMPPVAARYGINDPESWAIGQPVEVRFNGGATFVKAKLYSGDTPLAARANLVWDGLTKLNPPRRYYASVGGAVLAKAVRLDPKTGDKVGVVTRTRWNNLALTESPVCQHLEAAASPTPIGVFAKSLGGFVVAKALSAGYATDAAAMTGGQALSMQSLDRGGSTYWDGRERLAGDIRKGKVKQVNAQGLVDHCVQSYGMSHDEAAEHVERFMRDLKSKMKRSVS